MKILFLNLCDDTYPSQVMAVVKRNPSANAGDTGDDGSISESRRSPGGGNDNPFQHSCLGNPVAEELVVYHP